MSLLLRTSSGSTEAVISDEGSLRDFYHVANILTQDFAVLFHEKLDDFDTIYWDFKFKNRALTLHYNIYNGITIFPTKIKDAGSKDNKAVVELAGLLENKLFNQDLRNIA